jgi:hypothetical protein
MIEYTYDTEIVAVETATAVLVDYSPRSYFSGTIFWPYTRFVNHYQYMVTSIAPTLEKCLMSADLSLSTYLVLYIHDMLK